MHGKTFDNAPTTTIFEWFDTLDDAEQERVLAAVCQIADDLGVVVDGKSQTTQKLLDLVPHVPTAISFN